MKYFSMILFFGLLIGCVGNVAVRMPLQEIQKENMLARVKVNDLRAPGVAASKREAAFGVPMGNITFDPPEVQVIKNLLEIELSKLLEGKGLQSQQDYVCDINEFGVNTNTTPLYWDVICRVSLVLKYNEKEYNLSGTDTERT